VRARLAAYAGVQLRDFLVGRLPLLLTVTVLATWALLRATGVTPAVFDPSAGIGGREQVQLAFESALGAYALVGALLAAQGLVARDRWRGFDRVLFSRPLNPARYYLQGFIVGGMAIVALGVVGAGVFTVALRPVSVAGVAAYIALAWLTIGGFAFVVSTLTAYHLPIVLAALGGAALLDRFATSLRAAGTPAAVVETAQYLLPPVHVVAALREPFARGRVVSLELLAWPLGFGVLCLIAVVLLLYRRPFRS
jgi:hypothetical protein